MHTMWPSLSHRNPDPVPSTFAFSSSFDAEPLFGFASISRSLMKTTEGEASYSNTGNTLQTQNTKINMIMYIEVPFFG